MVDSGSIHSSNGGMEEDNASNTTPTVEVVNGVSEEDAGGSEGPEVSAGQYGCIYVCEYVDILIFM